MKDRRFINYSEQLIHQLETMEEVLNSTNESSERNFDERKFPIKYNLIKGKCGWNEQEVRQFYSDPENLVRTIYCKNINVDETDDWGMFGFTPGFIYIEGKKYEGNKTLADQAASLGLSVATDPSIGLGLMNHFDYFPKHKYDYQLIRKSDYPEMFELICEIVIKRKLGNSGSDYSLQSGI